MMRFLKRKWRPAYMFWLAVPLVLWFSLRQAPLAEILQNLSRLGPPQLALLLTFNLMVMLVFSSRWWLILRAQGHRLPYLSLVGYRTAAFSISYFTPGTQFGGEPLQVHLLERRHNLPGSTALAAVTLDKLFELSSNFAFLMIGVILTLQVGLIAWVSPQIAFLCSGGLLLFPLAYLLALWSGRYPISWLIAKIPANLLEKPRIHRAPTLVASVESQVSRLLKSEPQTLLAILLTSALIWLLSLAEYWLALYLLGARLNLFQIISGMTAARLAFLTPIPGGLGALEASQTMSMQAMGFSPALGISISLWIRVRDVALGLLGVWWGATLARRQKIRTLPYQAIE
jgi:uncharacterized protein (TIRG00374 family)